MVTAVVESHGRHDIQNSGTSTVCPASLLGAQCKYTKAPTTGSFPQQMTSNVEDMLMLGRHHVPGDGESHYGCC